MSSDCQVQQQLAELPRWILHADMDAFYASIEQRERPELKGRPVIVGGGSARGVVTAASYEARTFGVRSAMPGYEARRLCPDGVFLPGRMGLYRQVSQQINEVFKRYTPVVEPLALDEAFLDISGSLGHHDGEPRRLARSLKLAILERTQLRCSVGVAKNRLVAKLACGLSKPNGLLVVERGGEQALLAPLPLRQLWGIGPVTERRVRALGLRTIGDIATAEDSVLRAAFRDRAAHMRLRSRGEDETRVVCDRAARSCGEENTFETDVQGHEVISGAITAHAESVARRLRKMGLKGRTVTLKLKLARKQGMRVARSGQGEEPRYPGLTRSRTLPEPTDDARVIRQTAIRLFEQLALGEAIRLIGVTLSQMEAVSGAAQQLKLFDEGRLSSVRSSSTPAAQPLRDSAALGPVLDKIQDKFGKSAIRRAVEQPTQASPSLNRRPGDD